MLARVLSIVRKDLAYTRKEHILLYMLFFPLVLAVIMRMFLPSVEQLDMTFAVDQSVPAAIAEQLETYARVERFADRNQLAERVQRFDDVPGIYYADGHYFVLLEGNEGSAIQDLPGAILDSLNASRQLALVERESLGRVSLFRQFVAIILVISCGAIGGLAIGLSVVNDRETRTMRAYGVSPVSSIEYIAGKSAVALLLVLVLSLAVAAIVMGGTAIDYGRLTLAVLASLGINIAVGLALGLLANNQITAIAVVKVLFIVTQGVPVAALLLPKRFLAVLYPFPNYWAFESFRRVILEPSLSTMLTNSITLLSSVLLISLMVPVVRNKFRLG